MQLTLILGLFSHCWSCVKENQTKYYSAAEKQGPNSDPVYMGDHPKEFQHGSDFNINANVIFSTSRQNSICFNKCSFNYTATYCSFLEKHVEKTNH